MRTRARRTVLTTVAVVAAGLAVAAVAPPANAVSIRPGDDRMTWSPTRYWAYSNLTAASVSSTLSTNKARLSDLKVTPGSPNRFTVVEVSNSGAYKTPFWWYYGLTAAQVNSDAAANSARVTVLQGYKTSAGIRFAAVMVPNTGASKVTWNWRYGTEANLESHVTNAQRPISFGDIGWVGSSREYTVVYIDNTGANFVPWSWSFDEHLGNIDSEIRDQQARIVDIDPGGEGLYSALMYRPPNPNPDWGVDYTSSSVSDALAFAAHYGARIADLAPYTEAGTKYFTVLLISNIDTLSLRLSRIIGPAIPVWGAKEPYPYYPLPIGTYGFELSTDTGAQLAALRAGAKYEPASAIKILIHVYLIHQEALAKLADTDAVNYLNDATAGGELCPDTDTNTITVKSTVVGADEAMMYHSDNGATLALENLLGKSNILAYAQSLGLTSTQLNHHLGCPTPTTHNVSTLNDLSKMYAAIADQKITSSRLWNGRLRARMLNQAVLPSYYNSICPVVQTEATKLGKSATTATNFCHAILWLGKGGDYTHSDGTGFVDHDTSGTMSLTTLPFKSSTGTITPKNYVFGEYVDDIEPTPQQPVATVTAARKQLYNVAITPYIDAALKTW